MDYMTLNKLWFNEKTFLRRLSIPPSKSTSAIHPPAVERLLYMLTVRNKVRCSRFRPLTFAHTQNSAGATEKDR